MPSFRCNHINASNLNMRLLKAETKELVQFLPNQIPPYAILSHTWSCDPDEEVLFSDIGKEEALQKPAYQQKVVPVCKKTLQRGIEYVWIDTCCIDKSSSAELQEAVNSMFKWYMHSSICFVYLEDVPSKMDESSNSEIGDDSITKSRWFTRGWTLQELVAPGKLIFYSKHWNNLGTRASHANLISKKTKIDESILDNEYPQYIQDIISYKSVANKMSWAAFRETTRPEDIAYCLMGIFDVNMPLLYGEGEKKAFYRLQEEILKVSHDQSLLAWTPSDNSEGLRGPLAEHPIEFRDANNIVPLPGVPDTYALMSSGLRIDLLLVPSYYLPFQHRVLGVLRCHYRNNFTGPLAIPLEPQESQGNRVYARRREGLITIDRSKLINDNIFQNGPASFQNQTYPQNQTITIYRNPRNWYPDCTDLHFKSWPADCNIIKVIPEKGWNPKTRIMNTNFSNATRVFIFEHDISKTRFAVVFRYNFRLSLDTLGRIEVFELDPDMLYSPSWLYDWKSEPEIEDMELSEKDCQANHVLRFKREGPLKGIKAGLRKGHIMGVPFWVLDVQVIGDSPALGDPEESG